MATFSFDESTRQPWNNKIFPGNYVAHLNAYRDQGVVALPGAVFFRGVGALVLNPDVDGNLVNGELPAGTYDLKILSPDLRQDDKPRLDKPMVIPAGAVVYRSAVNVVNLEATGTQTVAVDGLTSASLEASLAAVGGVFPEDGASTAFDGFTTVSTEAADATISAAYSGDLKIVDPDSQAADLIYVYRTQ